MPPTPQAPPMPASTRTLISLPPEVLSEILIFTLDRPQGPLRPAVLQTCSLLHSIGLPLLFRFVRLGTVASWKAMVGVGGWLVSVRDNGRGMGRHVRELELNRKGTGGELTVQTVVDHPGTRTADYPSIVQQTGRSPSPHSPSPFFIQRKSSSTTASSTPGSPAQQSPPSPPSRPPSSATSSSPVQAPPP